MIPYIINQIFPTKGGGPGHPWIRLCTCSPWVLCPYTHSPCSFFFYFVVLFNVNCLNEVCKIWLTILCINRIRQNVGDNRIFVWIDYSFASIATHAFISKHIFTFAYRCRIFLFSLSCVM